MSAEDRRRHLEQAVAEGGTIITAKGGFTRRVPSTSDLARTPEERESALGDIERMRRELDEREARLRGGYDPDERARAGRAQFGEELPEDFPGREHLAQAGINTRSDLKGL